MAKHGKVIPQKYVTFKDKNQAKETSSCIKVKISLKGNKLCVCFFPNAPTPPPTLPEHTHTCCPTQSREGSVYIFPLFFFEVKKGSRGRQTRKASMERMWR